MVSFILIVCLLSLATFDFDKYNHIKRMRSHKCSYRFNPDKYVYCIMGRKYKMFTMGLRDYELRPEN